MPKKRAFFRIGWCWRHNKIHLWRHSIVLALHYFQGMACYRSATLLEVMDTRSFWNMFVFSRVIYRQSCISEEHSNNSCFSMNKKKLVVTARLEPTPSIRCVLVHRTRKSDRKSSARFFCLVLPVWYCTSGVLVLSLFTCHGYEKNNLLPVVWPR